jgi:hypothetical protein
VTLELGMRPKLFGRAQVICFTTTEAADRGP